MRLPSDRATYSITLFTFGWTLRTAFDWLTGRPDLSGTHALFDVVASLAFLLYFRWCVRHPLRHLARPVRGGDDA